MTCPQCRNQLNKEVFGNIEVLSCTPHGLLLQDPDKLNDVINHTIKIDNPPEQKIMFDRKIIGDLITSEDPLNCPSCNQRMSFINYGYNSNVILDKCFNCGSFWIDNGELQKIAIYRKGNENLREFGAELAKETKKSMDMSNDLNSLQANPAFFTTSPLLIGDELSSAQIPVATILIIIFNIIIFCLSSLMGTSIIYYFGFIPAAPITFTFFATLVTSIFLHGSLLHLGLNMFYLWIFGDQVEEELGFIKYICFYIIIGIFSNLLAIPFYIYLKEPIIGASGAVSGMMGAYLYLHPKARLKFLLFNGKIHIKAVYFLVYWIIMNLIFAIFLPNYENIAWGVHVSGFVLGLLVMVIAKFLKSNSVSS